MPWTIADMGEEGVHIFPNDEVNEKGESLHITEGCRCGAYFDDEDGVWVHNAFDGREKFENGERKPS